MDFVDRLLKCSDCGSDFIFTAGEQLFFFDRQFKNDPKRCKLCKAKRAGLGRGDAAQMAALAGQPGAATALTLPLSRTETRTECSACGIETTVPFRPTQGRPVFCRSCFQLKRPSSLPSAPGTLETAAPLLPESSPATMAAIAEAPAAALPMGNYPAGMDLHPALERIEILDFA